MTDDLDLRNIRAFVAIVEAGDFTAAARSLRVTRSTVGKALVRLEASLGVKLLHRTTRRVSMTSDGAAFHGSCVQLLANLAAAEHAVRQPREAPGGILKISLPDAYGRARIMPVLHAYMRRWPEVGVEAAFSDRIIDIVEDGFDLAIRIGGVDASHGLVTRVVDRFRGVLCASPGYLAVRGKPDAFQSLDGHDVLHFGQDGQIMSWPWGCPTSRPRSSREAARMIVDSAEALRRAALEGFGIAYLPDFLIASDLDEGTLTALQSQMAEVHLVYPNRRLLPTRVRLFIDMVAAEVR